MQCACKIRDVSNGDANLVIERDLRPWPEGVLPRPLVDRSCLPPLRAHLGERQLRRRDVPGPADGEAGGDPGDVAIIRHASGREKQQDFRRRGRDACRGPFESLLSDACVLSVYAP